MFLLSVCLVICAGELSRDKGEGGTIIKWPGLFPVANTFCSTLETSALVVQAHNP